MRRHDRERALPTMLCLLLVIISGCECYPDTSRLSPGDLYRGLDPTPAIRVFGAQDGIVHWLQMPHDATVHLEPSRAAEDSLVDYYPCSDSFSFQVPLALELTSSDGYLDGASAALIDVRSDLKVVPNRVSMVLPGSAVALENLLPAALIDEDSESNDHRLTLSLEMVVTEDGPRFQTARLSLSGRDNIALADLEFSP